MLTTCASCRKPIFYRSEDRGSILACDHCRSVFELGDRGELRPIDAEQQQAAVAALPEFSGAETPPAEVTTQAPPDAPLSEPQELSASRFPSASRVIEQIESPEAAMPPIPPTAPPPDPPMQPPPPASAAVPPPAPPVVAAEAPSPSTLVESTAPRPAVADDEPTPVAPSPATLPVEALPTNPSIAAPIPSTPPPATSDESWVATRPRSLRVDAQQSLQAAPQRAIDLRKMPRIVEIAEKVVQPEGRPRKEAWAIAAPASQASAESIDIGEVDEPKRPLPPWMIGAGVGLLLLLGMAWWALGSGSSASSDRGAAPPAQPTAAPSAEAPTPVDAASEAPVQPARDAALGVGDARPSSSRARRRRPAPSKDNPAPNPRDAAPSRPASSTVETVAPAPPAPAPREPVTPRSRARAEYNSGNAALNAGDYQSAIASLKRAIRNDPGFGMPYRSLGIAYLKLNRQSAAMAAYQEFLRLEPSHADAPRIEALLRSYGAR